MAAHGNDHHTPGTMDISQHKRAYEGFLWWSKWTTIFILAIMVFLAVFRTN